jgi:plasmid stabilization system protein ParE
MRYRVEFAAATERDFELIFDHLLESYASFGESQDEAATHAAQRVIAIRKAAGRLATAPLRGAARDDVQPGVRQLTIDRATAHRKFKRPLKPDDQTEASQEGPTAAVRSWRIVAAAPIRTVSPLPLGLVWP